MIEVKLQFKSPEEAISALQKLNGPVVQPETITKSVPPVPQAPAAPMLPEVQDTAEDEEDDANTPAEDGEGLDSRGLPWDARIHASSKAKVKDGTWRPRRNVKALLVEQVEAELRNKANAVPPPSPANTTYVGNGETTPVLPRVTPTAPVAPSVPAAPAIPTAPALTVEMMSALSAAPAAPSAPAAPAVAGRSFDEVVQLITAKFTEGVPGPKIMGVLASHGVEAVPLLAGIDASRLAQIYAGVEALTLTNA